MLQRIVATIFVCFGMLHVVPAMTLLQEADSSVGRLPAWFGVAVIFAIGGSFVAAGYGVMSNAPWWRAAAAGGAAVTLMLALVGLPLPTGFLLICLAVGGGMLRFWFRSRLVAA